MERQTIILITLITVATAVLAARDYLQPFLPFGIGPSLPTQNPLGGNPAGSWNILHHLGGNGPWIRKRTNVVDGGTDPPAGCRVDQVHMISRHAERYPTRNAVTRMLELYQRLKHIDLEFQGDISFVNAWNFFMSDPNRGMENLVPTGPYAGTLGAFTTGVRLRTQYEDLLWDALNRSQTSLWASDSKRVVETARYFAAGFYGLDWQDFATLHVIPETPNLGADTLTPGDTCLKYYNNADDYGHDYGYRMLKQFQWAYLPTVAKRLQFQNPNVTFSLPEIYTMQEICGFETLAKGSSPWCDVFTHDEWRHFEYARDLLHYYRSGAGNKYGATMGWLWLNATTSLLQAGPDAGPLFFSFVHDGDIVPFLAALDLFPQHEHLPATHIPSHRNWSTSDVTPMGGRIILERLTRPVEPHCWTNAPFYPNHRYCAEMPDEVYIRINVNDGIVAMPGCDDGPGRSCPLEKFTRWVQRRGTQLGDFRELCGLHRDAPERITFLHQ